MNGREFQIEMVDLDELVASIGPGNPKRHAFEALEASVNRFGYMAPVLRNRDGEIIAGIGRIELLLMLRSRGAPPPEGVRIDGTRWLVPVITGPDLDPENAQAYRLADNKLVELGGWDLTLLAEELEHALGSSAGLDGIGFSVADLEELRRALESTAPDPKDPDDAPPLPDPGDLYVHRGDIYELGQHLVMCGDATDGRDVDRLIGNRRVALFVGDPPYNVALPRHGGKAYGKALIANDDLPRDAWERFVRRWAREIMTRVDGPAYIFMSSKEMPLVSRVLEDLGGHWSDTIIWKKDRFVIGRADYQREYEMLWYGWPAGRKRQWHGGRAQSDVWEIPRPTASKEHPTMKPVELVERALTNSSEVGDTVLDLFLGSGTTVIAAERTGRRCLGMELEPRYVQVAIERWQASTGRTAMRVETTI